jgi:hypothetical protein
MPISFIKDPEAVLDYKWDWTNWLEEDETILAYTVTVPTGIVLDTDFSNGKMITAWFSGGTAAKDYWVNCHIITSQNREDDRRISIQCRNR